MKLDLMNFGTEETAARFTCEYDDTMLLMEACAALREARFPGVLERLPRMFDEEDLARVLGSEEQANEMMIILEAEQAFHQALHLFPGGHEHGEDGDYEE